MQIVKAKYEGKDNVLTIKPSGDWHVGHVNYTEPLVLDWVNSLNENTRGLLMGDLAECATKTSIGKGLFDTNMTPQKQRDYIIELLKPKAQYIDGLVIGNHEERIVNDTSLDIIKDIGNILGIPYLHYQGYIKYAWNGVAYTIMIRHGSGGGATISTALKHVEDMANRSLADVYCCGHFHKRATSDRIFDVPDLYNTNIREIEQHFVLTGSALSYEDGYGELKGLQKRRLGFPTIQMVGKPKHKHIIVQK